MNNQEIYHQTPRMFLRKLSDEDRENLFQLDSDPLVTKFISDGKPSTYDEIEATLTRIQDYYKKFDDRFGAWAAIEKKSNSFMGWFHLRPDKKDLDNLKNLELGYRLKKSFWGRASPLRDQSALRVRRF